MAALVKTQTNSPPSPRDSVAVDERTKTLPPQDTSDRIADFRRPAATLDIPVGEGGDRGATPPRKNDLSVTPARLRVHQRQSQH